MIRKTCKMGKGLRAQTLGRRCQEKRGAVGLYSVLPPMPQGEKSPRDTLNGGMRTEGQQPELWVPLRKKRQIDGDGRSDSEQ